MKGIYSYVKGIIKMETIPSMPMLRFSALQNSLEEEDVIMNNIYRVILIKEKQEKKN